MKDLPFFVCDLEHLRQFVLNLPCWVLFAFP